MSDDFEEQVIDPTGVERQVTFNGSQAVIAYRLSLVEKNIGNLDVKLDKVINEYPTITTLDLILKPMKDKIKELEQKEKDEIANTSKLRIALTVAIVSPIISAVVLFITTYATGGTSG